MTATVRSRTIGDILNLPVSSTAVALPWIGDTSHLRTVLDSNGDYDNWWTVRILSSQTFTISQPLYAIVLEATADQSGSGVWQVGLWEYRGDALSQSYLDLIHAVRCSDPTIAKADLISCIGPVRGAAWTDEKPRLACATVMNQLIHLINSHSAGHYRTRK